MHKVFAATELSKFHVIKFCKLIRLKEVILNQKSATFFLVDLKWFEVALLTGVLRFIFGRILVFTDVMRGRTNQHQQFSINS